MSLLPPSLSEFRKTQQGNCTQPNLEAKHSMPIQPRAQSFQSGHSFHCVDRSW